MRAPLSLLLAVALLGPTGCGGETAGRASASISYSVSATALFQRMAAAPSSTAYGGTRLVQTEQTTDGVSSTLIYREAVLADGLGSFSVEPTDVLAPSMFPHERDLFMAMQKAREGFTYRYRDFLIRNLELFFTHYRVVFFDTGTQVAGRNCTKMRVIRRVSPTTEYIIEVDDETGLVLSSIETDLTSGQVISSLRFESFTLTPNLSGPLHPPSNENAFSSASAASNALGFTLKQPKVLPAGYQLLESVVIPDPSDSSRSWAKLVYSDGIEQVFFLHGGPISTPTSPTLNGPILEYGSGHNDTVVTFQFGPWTVAQGNVRNHRLIAIGKVAESDLLLLIESSL